MLVTLLAFFSTILFVNTKLLKVQLICAYNDPQLINYIGYFRVAGAVGVAWDKIVADRLLPGYEAVNLSIVHNDCNVPDAAGAVLSAIHDDVDVVLGPPCSGPAKLVGSIAKFYNYPLVLWGPQFSSSLLNRNEYPTILSSSPSSINQASTIIRVAKKYGWNNLAVLFYVSRSELLPRCTQLNSDLERLLSSEQNITIVRRKQITNATRANFNSALTDIAQVSRVTILCIESPTGRRDLMLSIKDLGMDNDEFVWLFAESRGAGFTCCNGTNQMWMYQGALPSDGLDEVALSVARKMFVLDTQSFNNTDGFRSAVIQKMASAQFNCSNCTNIDPLTSNVGELHDAMYLYALALNKTLSAGMNDTNGTVIANFGQIEFQGVTGNVKINRNGTRDPIFYLWMLDQHNTPQVVLKINEQLENSSEAFIKEVLPESVMWSSHGGVRPLNIPICGFDGKLCPPSFIEEYLYIFVIIVIVSVMIIALVIFAVWFLIRLNKREEQRLNSLWHVPFGALVRPENAEPLKSSRSLQSSVTASTKMSLDSKKSTKLHEFFTFGDDSVAARKHAAFAIITKKDAAELRKMHNVDNENLCKFFGLCTDGPALYSVWRYCMRGSLKDIIAKGAIQMDAFIKFSLIRDVIEGLNFMHHSFLGAHGWLTSKVCLVDERWKVKISFYGLECIKLKEHREVADMLWMAPEAVRNPTNPVTKAGDIYSFAIICSEVITRKTPFDFEQNDLEVDEIIYRVKKGGSQPYRPNLDNDEERNTSLNLLVQDCWSEEASSRPTSEQAAVLIKSLNHNRSSNLMDHVFNVLEQYAQNLEEEVDARMKELTEEKKKSDVLLYRLLPQQVADKLKLGQAVEPETYDFVTLFFSDVVSFTTLASRCTPLQVVNLLNSLYTTFDDIIGKHDVYKVETIGDGYLCASGLPHRNGNQHAKEIAEMSFELLKAIKIFAVPHLPKERINIRVGLHTGPVVTGVVGVTMPRYCLFGDSVNTASRMESNGKAGRIHISTETKNFLTEVIGGYQTEPRGEIIIKGKGAITTHWLLTEEEMAERRMSNGD